MRNLYVENGASTGTYLVVLEDPNDNDLELDRYEIDQETDLESHARTVSHETGHVTRLFLFDDLIYTAF